MDENVTTNESFETTVETGGDKVNVPEVDVPAFDAEAERQKIREELEAEYAEKERISKLTKEEQDKIANEKNINRISELEKELQKRDMKEKAVSELTASGYPVGLSSILNYSDEKSFSDSLQKVKEVFDTALQQAVNERLKGKTPEGLHENDTRNSLANIISENIRGGF